MSRQEADLIAVLIFTYDSTRLLILLVEPQFGTNPSGVFPMIICSSLNRFRLFSSSGRKDRLLPVRLGYLAATS